MIVFSRAAASSGATDFYPATGFRYSTSGYLGDVGTNGYFWSGSPISATSADGARLIFQDIYVNPEGSTNRSTGFPVRCVQE